MIFPAFGGQVKIEVVYIKVAETEVASFVVRNYRVLVVVERYAQRLHLLTRRHDFHFVLVCVRDVGAPNDLISCVKNLIFALC